ncbi:hypothetical protein D3C76_712130 [compost metagenome]
MAPLGIVDAGEEVVTRHYQQVLRLQSLVERLAVDRQAFEPEPEEEGAFRLVDVEARIGNGFSQ